MYQVMEWHEGMTAWLAFALDRRPNATPSCLQTMPQAWGAVALAAP